MIVKSIIGPLAAAMLLAACSQVPPRYFGPQLASASGEVEPQAINSPAYAIRPPLPGRPGYLDMIRYIDSGVKYIDPYAEFFISYDGQMCFRGLVNRQAANFENYQNYRSEEHTSELQSRRDLVCRLLLEKKKKKT